MELIENLIKIGFTRHESILYLTLCKEGELSGYEAAKISGIPRSNAYLALSGLVEKGGAWKIESEVIRYAAVPIDELTANLRREYYHTLEYLSAHVPERDELTKPFFSITGEIQVINKVKYIIENAAQRIYLSLDQSELNLLKVELSQALQRGLKVVLLIEQPIKLDGAIIYLKDANQSGQIRLIADSAEVLTGEFEIGGKANCIYSKNINLVKLIKDSLTNEIKLIQINHSRNK